MSNNPSRSSAIVVSFANFINWNIMFSAKVTVSCFFVAVDDCFNFSISKTITATEHPYTSLKYLPINSR